MIFCALAFSFDDKIGVITTLEGKFSALNVVDAIGSDNLLGLLHHFLNKGYLYSYRSTFVYSIHDILNAFSWQDTPEGSDFWDNIYEELVIAKL